jgi:hypothetical protein
MAMIKWRKKNGEKHATSYSLCLRDRIRNGAHYFVGAEAVSRYGSGTHTYV